MANEVYANNREIAGKAASAGIVICAFPDVCFTPPQTPPTPTGVPIPYPNTGKATDTTKGSKKTKIKDQEIVLKNQSYFKTSYGDEAGCTPKKGIITSNNRGKVYFQMWSMDVKVEGKNVTRMLDITTNNHRSQVGDTPTFPYIHRMAMGQVGACRKERNKVVSECSDKKDEKGNVQCPDDSSYQEAKKLHQDTVAETKSATKTVKSVERDAATDLFRPEHMKYAKAVRADSCNRAARCMLVPWTPNRCCPPQTPHHLVPKSSFYQKTVEDGTKMPKCDDYNASKAPCICATGGSSTGAHGAIHAEHANVCKQWFGETPHSAQQYPNAKTCTARQAERAAAAAAKKVFPQCSQRCIEAQLRKVHQEQGIDARTDVKVMYEDRGHDALTDWRS